MLIDGFTIIAQIINFLILIFLLRRFLYKPILNVMEQRERTVKEHLETARRKSIQAKEELKRYQLKNEELEEHFELKKSQAEEEVENWRKDSLKFARKEVEDLLEDWHQTVREEKDYFITDLRRFAVDQTYTIARKVLHDLADSTLEERMVFTFISGLKKDELDLSSLKEELEKNGRSEIILRSAFDLSTELQERLQQELQVYFDREIALVPETQPALGAGFELVGQDGHKVVWNLERYLDSLEDELDLHLQDHFGNQPGIPAELEGSIEG